MNTGIDQMRMGKTTMLDEWLVRRMTIEEVEAEHTVRDDRLGPAPVVFGFINDRWLELVEQMEPGDEIWEFKSPPESWDNLCGRAGIAVVRDGQIVDQIISMLN